ncbi:hybrid sensor histidine kinase/response regulator transcription factor [Cyclobacterium plantarum]|uniref:hybrid sensor histidine kinase/response regulator transcription factor n=1 Tax=Cyclobacterium plantarum TaxID=2716263 RepID=UPI003F70250C
MQKHLKLGFAILFLSWFWNGNAQSISPKFFHITVEDGLSQGSVFSIFQDHKGFIWIGTRDGLNKYDSQNFTIYRNEPGDSLSLTDNYITSIFEDSLHRLWVGTFEGLNLYDASQDKFYRIKLPHWDGEESVQGPLIFSIIEDHEGRVWVATSLGLYFIDKESQLPVLAFHQSLFPEEGVQSSSIQSIYMDQQQKLWLCSESGLYQVRVEYIEDKKLRLAIEKKYFQGPSGKALNDGNTTTVQEIGNQLYWIGTKNGGINVLNGKTGQFSYITKDDMEPEGLADDEIRSILKDRDGGFWIGTFKGLNYYSENGGWQRFQANQKDPYSLSHNSIRPIFQDKKGGIWIGTYFGGLNVVYKDVPRFDDSTYSKYVNNISHHVISSIAETRDNKLWIGTDGGGLNLLDRTNNQVKTFTHDPSNPKSLSHNSIKSIHLDGNEDLWIGTYLGGINLLKKNTSQFIHIKNDPSKANSLSDNSVYAIEEGEEGGMWFGTHGGGLNFLPGNKDRDFLLYHSSALDARFISSDYIRVLKMDSKGNLWVGTENGLNVKWKGNETFDVYKFSLEDAASISGDIIVSIFEDSKKRIWLGTYGDGLNLYLPESNQFQHFSTKDGFPGNNIFGISEDQGGNIWLSTNNGLAKFDPDKREVKNFDKRDGISGNEFISGAYAKLSSGEMAFGSSQGLTLFHPDSLKFNEYVPPVVLTDFKLFNKSVIPGPDQILAHHISETEEIELRYDQNIFTVEFAVLNFLLPDKNKYAYLLDGFEDDWNYVENPTATYTNLNAGNYTLLVKGSNNDGLWNEVPTALKIKILPPPWKTWYAYIIYAGLVFGAILLLVNFTKVRARLEHDLQLEHFEKERQKEIHEIKLNFFTNVSHEFRTPLTLITTPIQQLLSENKVKEENRPLFITIMNNANRLLKLVNQLLDFRKQESGNIQLQVESINLVQFLQEVVLTFNYLSEKKNISLLFETSDNEIQVYFDQDLLERVMVNLLSNALKFTPEYGEIKVKIKKYGPAKIFKEGYVEISVNDNGIGIPKKDLEKVFDWFYQIKDHKNIRNDENGSGLGLALAKSIVLAHGGNIKAYSDTSKNNKYKTSFIIQIPLGSAHFDLNSSASYQTREYSQELNPRPLSVGMMENNQEINSIWSKNSESGTFSKAGNSYVLLIVEDNEELRKLIVECLKDYYTTLEASQGNEAWDIIQSEIPDVIISDIMMPECDGIQLLNKVKADLRTSHIPILFLTARSSLDSIILGLGEGGDDYITKPFQLEILKLKIANILSSRERFRKKFIRDYILNPKEEEKVSPENEFLKKLVKIIEENIGQDEFNVNILSLELGFSRPVLYRKIKQLTDLSVIELINNVRLKKAANLLSSNQFSISEVAYLVGFSDPKYFSKSFKAQFGKSPRAFMGESKAGNENDSLIL